MRDNKIIYNVSIKIMRNLNDSVKNKNNYEKYIVRFHLALYNKVAILIRVQLKHYGR